APQVYISPEHKASLEQFQASLKAGTARNEVDALSSVLEQRRAKIVEEFRQCRVRKDKEAGLSVLVRVIKTLPQGTSQEPRDIDRAEDRLRKLLRSEDQTGTAGNYDEFTGNLVDALGSLLKQRDALVLQDLAERLPTTNVHYHPDDPK